MRVDQLVHVLDASARPRGLAIDSRPAELLSRSGVPALSGADVNAAYGHLIHYTDAYGVALLQRTGLVGGGSRGVWLTPSAYSACMAPYNLGLRSPKDIALIVDVSGLPQVYGPGTSPAAGPPEWPGGAVEFFAPLGVPQAAIVDVTYIEPCGDGLS